MLPVKDTQTEFLLTNVPGLVKQIKALEKASPLELDALRLQLKREGVNLLLPLPRPKGTYYCRHYAELLRPHIEDMIASGKIEKKFPKSAFRGMSILSLRVMIQQAILFLREDVEAPQEQRDRYKAFWEKIEIRKDLTPNNQAIWIRWIKNTPKGGTYAHTEIPAVNVEVNSEKTWRMVMDEWLDDPRPPCNPLLISDLDLSFELVEELDVQLQQIPNCMAVVRKNYIKIIRTDLPMTLTKKSKS